MSEDRQLRAVHLILDFNPISKTFQEIGHAIRAGDPRINCFNISRPNFLAQDDLPPVPPPVHQIPPLLAIPLQQVPPGVVAIVEEEIASSSHLSLEEEIDKFCFEEEQKAPEELVDLLKFETKSDRLSIIHQPKFSVALVDTSSKEEMYLKKRPSLRGLMANRNKRAASTERPKAQISTNLPPLPPPPAPTADPKLRDNYDPKKKRPLQELEEGEVPLQRGTKQ